MLDIRLDALESSLLPLLLLVGVAMILPSIADNRRRLDRTLIFLLAGVLAVRYVWWRATQTLAPAAFDLDCLASWTFFAIEAVAVLSSLSAFTILTRTENRSDEAGQNRRWWGGGPTPHVVVLIATYNEEREVLERTIVGAKALDHGEVEILVLDDGRREWLGAFCAELGVRHVTRPDNRHSKAGNVNHALELLEREGRAPDFVAVLDADFVPHVDFLKRTLALFHEPDVGLVQTPQHFFNPDPIQHNLGLSRSYPDEQRFFFDHLQPARDAWGIAFCCGTSSVVRWQALQAIGNLPVESITEDFLLTLTLQDKGWRTVYLNEALTEGLAPEGLKEYVTQRARWCLGLMQIARGRLGPLSRNALRLRDRWSVADSVLYWVSTFPFRLAALVFPLFYWFFNITVVDAAVPDVIRYFGPYYLWVLVSLNFVARGLIVPVINDVGQLLGAIPISRAAFTGLIQPKGHPFKVTAKGGDRSRIVVQWTLMRPHLIFLVLTFAGLLLGILTDRFAFNDAGDGKSVILFWSLYNLLILGVTVMVCIELPRREQHVADRPQRGFVLRPDGSRARIWVGELTSEAARVRGLQLPVGSEISLDLPEIGAVPARVEALIGDGMGLELQPDAQQRDRLLRRLYAEGGAPGIARSRLDAMLGGLVRRLALRRS